MQINADINDAVHVLERQALGIGENHEEAGGREFALQLLAAHDLENGNPVRNFFIEIPPWGQNCVEAAAGMARQNGSLQEVMTRLAPLSGVENLDLFKTVVARALIAGVKVYCADCSVRTGTDWMTTRNWAIADRVKAVARTDFSGCLLLWGSDHFDGQYSGEEVPTLCELIAQMDWVKF